MAADGNDKNSWSARIPDENMGCYSLPTLIGTRPRVLYSVNTSRIQAHIIIKQLLWNDYEVIMIKHSHQ